MLWSQLQLWYLENFKLRKHTARFLKAVYVDRVCLSEVANCYDPNNFLMDCHETQPSLAPKIWISTDFVDPLTFPIAPPPGQTF